MAKVKDFFKFENYLFFSIIEKIYFLSFLFVKKILFILVFFFLYSQTQAYEYSRKTYTTSIWDYQIRLLKVDLTWDDRIVIWVSDSWESLWDLVERYNWKAWLNWAYFCPDYYPECKWKNFSNADRISYSEDFSRWQDTGERYIFSFDKNYIPFLFSTNNKSTTAKRSDIYMWLGNHPLILSEWQNMLEHYYDVGLIDKKMPKTRPKTFMCSSMDNKYFYMWIVYNARMDDLPTVLSDIWCYNALNLDAWRSTALYNNWEYYVWPGRNIMDAIIITDKSWDEKNKKILSLASSYKDLIMQKISGITKDEAQKQLILNNLIDKISKMLDKSRWQRKTLLLLLKNDLMKEIWKNISYIN